MTKIPLIIVEDQVLLRDALVKSLQARLSLDIVGQYSSASEARDNLAKFQIAQVALIDIVLGDERAFDLVTAIRDSAPRAKLIWMTGLNEDYLLDQAFDARLPGFVHKEDSFETIALAIEAVARGGRYYSQTVQQRRVEMRAQPNHYSLILSPREQEIIRFVGAGLSNEETAAFFGLSEGTVQAHRRNIMAKLQLHSASELQAYALRHGFVDLKSLRMPGQPNRPDLSLPRKK